MGLDDFTRARARALHAKIEADLWEIAEITHEMISSGQATVEKLARDTEQDLDHVRRVLKVWEMYGDDHRDGRLGDRAFQELLQLVRADDD
jgi:hypothetical protein